MRVKVLLLFGPTCVGKTDFIDKLFCCRAEVVNADSLQVYKGLNIGTAKPSPAILNRIPHHLVDILDYDEEWNVGEFCRRSEALVNDVHNRGLLPIISGGTAYYLKSWLYGLPPIPPADRELRQRVKEHWKGQNNRALHTALQEVDPISASRIKVGDRYRLLRALEVFEQCGQPLSSFKLPDTPRSDMDVLTIGLYRPRKDLVKRIEARVDSMLQAGLREEVNTLRTHGVKASDPGMKGIGYREWFGTPENSEPSLKEVREMIIRNTCRFAKRQMTFFSSIPDCHWIHVMNDDSHLEEARGLSDHFFHHH